MTLQLFCEDGADVRDGPILHRRMMQRPPDWHWLDPPPRPCGTKTAADVLTASTAEQHLELVRGWGQGVWVSWARHHATVRDWNSQSLRR